MAPRRANWLPEQDLFFSPRPRGDPPKNPNAIPTAASRSRENLYTDNQGDDIMRDEDIHHALTGHYDDINAGGVGIWFGSLVALKTVRYGLQFPFGWQSKANKIF
ncbi:hypothetical protein EYF80_045483 [Liparis tanakae]|uniref:Uncharacterized protein n=1 Tax=Liparis tanakae TaxID=230148 RepID=A0A4Z2FTX4_9TELE|nr:hypothetical protein EYF80_045483 [Liparis tanakae]